MDAKIDGVCRGNGTVLFRLVVHDLPETCTIDLSAYAKPNHLVPSRIREIPSTGIDEKVGPRVFVAAIPILNLHGDKLVLSQRDEQDAEVDTALLPYSFTKSKWESRLNYRANQRLCNELNRYGEADRSACACIAFWECIPDASFDIVRGAVTLPYENDNNLELLCCTDSLEPVQTDPVILGNTVTPGEAPNTQPLRELQFSVRVPHTAQSLVFTARDVNHPHRDGFAELEAGILDELKANASDTMKNAQTDPAYPEWFESRRTSTSALAAQAKADFDHCPLFSIVVPLYKTPLNYFAAMVESVLHQSYRNWELVLVNASPEDNALAQAVSKACSLDERIRQTTLEKNLGISENTNAGIAIASGDFVCFFDHDDVIEPDLLFEYASAVNKHAEIDLLYCDEDKLMPDGTLAQPFFKPDFSIDLLRNNNYICHMLTIRKSLLDTLEPNTAEFDGAQDHNLTLQAVEHARRVHHVPKILYHWRLSETSTAANADSKPYATTAGIKAVSSHLRRLGIQATVEQSRRPFTYKINYLPPSDNPLVSIVIPTKDHIDILDACIQSILSKSTYENYEIVIVENNSSQSETFEYYDKVVQQDGRIRIVRWPAEFNFSKIMNFGTAKARGDYLIYLNNDTEVITPSWIETMLGICARREVGIVGVRLYYPDDTIQHAGLCVTGIVAGHLGRNLPKNNWGYFAFADAEQNLSAVTAACMMTKKNVVEEAGGWCEDLAVAFNDVDFCLRVREKDYLVVYTPEVELYHHESISRGAENNPDKRMRFQKEIAYMNYQWAKYYVLGDPYMNPNITTVEPKNCYYHL